MRVVKWLVGITGAVSLFVMLLTFAIQIPTFGVWFYEYEFQKNGTYEQVNMTKPDLIEVTKHMLRYMQGKESQLNVETNVGGVRRYFFSEIEVYHMKDVADLFAVGYKVQTAACVLFVLAAVMFISPLMSRERRFFVKSIFVTGIATLSVGGLLVASIAADFGEAFVVFHEIFFTNDMWLLDYDVDLLINIVPTPFFIDIAALIAVLFALFSCSAVCACYAGLRVLKKETAGYSENA